MSFYAFKALRDRVLDATDVFAAFADLGMIRDRLFLPEEKEGDRLFADPETEMQRKINWARVRSKLLPYLRQRNPFFSSLCIVVVPNTFEAAKEGMHFSFRPDGDPDLGDSQCGLLRISTRCLFFPMDGQHRGAGIKEFLKERMDAWGWKVPVLFVPFADAEDTRQKFSDLNRNAKAPSKSIGIAFEGRDLLALAVKHACDIVPLFKGRVNSRTNSLPASSPAVVTLSTLYTGSEELVKAHLKASESTLTLHQLQVDPQSVDEEDAADLSAWLTEAWSWLAESFPDTEHASWVKLQAGGCTAADVRERYVYAHGLGVLAACHAAGVLIRYAGEDWMPLLREKLSAINWARTAQHWQNVAMVGTRVNNTGPSVKATAGLILAGKIKGRRPEYGGHEEPYYEALDESLAEATVQSMRNGSSPV